MINKHKILTLLIALVPNLVLIYAKQEYGLDLNSEQIFGLNIALASWIFGETNIDKEKIKQKSKSLDAIIQSFDKEREESWNNISDKDKMNEEI